MARVNNGIFGNYSGKVGSLVFYQVNDKTYVRSKGEITTDPSDDQQYCRREMALATFFVKSVLKFLRVGWLPEAKLKKSSAYHLAMSYHKKHAIKIVGSIVELDYSKALLSKGSLLPAQLPTVILDPEGLLFSWFTDQLQPQQSDWDQVMLMAYYPATGNAVYILGGVNRAAGSMVLEIPAEMRVGSVETYIAFVNTDRTATSDSVYTGLVNI
ncbi:DUF6266 family protein [Pedobacter frigoris]|uniref:DUF6266 family protein n=1 Tax=Pedobacter frigoris TaxID=2571272 RepID=UPI00292D46E2|nr:DUF6266 family protein [Pedobacter frigoris]